MKKHLVAALAAFSFAGGAHAVSVETSGVVLDQCTFGSVDAGVFGSNVSNPTRISTSDPGGTGGSVSFTYTGTPTLQVQAPTSLIESPELGSITPVFETLATTPAKGGLTFAEGIATTKYTTGSSDTLDLGQVVSSGTTDNLPGGTYRLAVTVTCS